MFKVPFFSLAYPHSSIKTRLEEVFAKIVKKGRFILDEEVSSFEEEFAAYQKTKYCVTVGNGHDAILISLKALKIGHGDEVIVPSHTCQATWLAISNSGAQPVPVEVNPLTYLIDPLLIENSITKKTKAIVPVHLYGHPCAMDKIMAIAKKNNLFVVEDNAQAHGAVFLKKKTGGWGHCNATSFYPTKNLGALGDGGAVTTDDKSLFHFAQMFRNYGSVKQGDHLISGINSRLDELQAAILRLKLENLNEWNDERKKNASLYFDLLKNVGDIQLPPKESKTEKPVFHQFVIQTTNRDELKKFLTRNGIETAVHYAVPVHLQKAYTHLGYKKNSLPVAEKLSKTVLSLPIFPGLKNEEVEKIGKTIKKFFA
jgi:dTDP-4-amino-4,6-dideoxygalactose transaminase